MKPVFAYRGYPVGDDGLVIGRAVDECDIVSLDETISRVHARVERNGHEASLVDLGSTNGLFVNQIRVEAPVVLSPGDLIGLGKDDDFHLRFENGVPPAYQWHYKLERKPVITVGNVSGADVYLGNLNGTIAASLHIEAGKSGLVARQKSKTTVFSLADAGAGIRLSGGPYSVEIRENDERTFQVSVSEEPFEANLHCQNLSLAINKQQILKDISLWLPPHQFVGIFGPSGSGKTTLLNALAGLNQASDQVFFGHEPITLRYEQYRKSVGYVPQDDIVHTALSVRDALKWVARLRLGSRVAKTVRDKLVGSILETMRLTHVEHTRVGDLSGGQRKRVSIMAELISRPPVLFLDEPTAGLDPSIEARIMRHFAATAETGASVIMTTHILYSIDQLDKVLFLCKGRLVYFGPPERLLDYFSATVGLPEIEINDVFQILETLDDEWFGSIKLTGASAQQKLDYLVEAYRSSEVYKREISLPQQQFASQQADIEGDAVTAAERPAGRAHPVSIRKDLLPTSDSWVLLSRLASVRLADFGKRLAYLLVPVLLGLLSLTISSGESDVSERQSEKVRIESLFEQGGRRFERGVTSLFDSGGELSAAETVYRLRFENISQAPVPMSLVVFLVMSSMFMGALLGALEVNTERAQYDRERQSLLRVSDYLLSKVVWLLLVLGVQIGCMYLFVLAQDSVRSLGFYNLFVFVTLFLSGLVSAVIGLGFSSIDKKGGQLAILFAFVYVLPQLLFMGVLGPQFYADYSPLMQGFADLTPGRWAVSSILNIVSLQEHYSWFARVVNEILGFDTGIAGYWKAQGAMAVQLLVGLMLAGVLLRGSDGRSW